jgi:hypothetical protein
MGYCGGERRSGFFNGERQRLAGCVSHLAGHLSNHGRATRPRGADTFGKMMKPEKQKAESRNEESKNLNRE